MFIILIAFLFYFFLYFKFQSSPHPILNTKIKYENNVNYNDLAALLLLLATFIVTAIAVIAALFAIFGFKNIKNEAIKGTEEYIKNSIEDENSSLRKEIILKCQDSFNEKMTDAFKSGSLPDELIDAIPEEILEQDFENRMDAMAQEMMGDHRND